MHKMQKMFSLLLLCGLLFAPPVSAGEAPVDDFGDGVLEVFTITVTLLDLETREHDLPLLTVKLPNEEDIALEAAEHCLFIDDRRQILFPSDFGRYYKGKKVTIDFIEIGPRLYVIEECRSGSQ
jgi:hypothetical protein